MLSGQEFPIDDWSTRDKQFAEVTDRAFEHRVFQSYPSLQSRKKQDGHTVWKAYRGEPYDAQEWAVVEGGWDHEHCSFCMAKITDGMTYWSNGNEVVLLCDSCHDHYADQMQAPA